MHTKDLSNHTNGVHSASDGQVFAQLKRSIARQYYYIFLRFSQAYSAIIPVAIFGNS